MVIVGSKLWLFWRQQDPGRTCPCTPVQRILLQASHLHAKRCPPVIRPSLALDLWIALMLQHKQQAASGRGVPQDMTHLRQDQLR
jgi:hypothetical protein